MDFLLSVFVNLIQILSLLFFFLLLGLSVIPNNRLQKDLNLVPVYGYAALIGLSYIISANFGLIGKTAVQYAILILFGILIIRLKTRLSEIKKLDTNTLKFFFITIAIPLITLLLPALLTGFKYFYGFVNYDFYYNSQDSMYLASHHVFDYNINNKTIVPLTWSANPSGRIAVGIIGSLLANVYHLTTLEFNSILLNTIVILFVLVFSIFTREFFNFKNKIIYLVLIIAILSAAYVQAYCYYVFGQISSIPIFLLFLVHSKRFIDKILLSSSTHYLADIGILGILINVLFVMYAILAFIAISILGAGIAVCIFLSKNKSRIVKQFLILAGIFILLFVAVRLVILPETLKILESWTSLSKRVADGTQKSDDFIIFSEYLTEVFLPILFGLVNYPSHASWAGFINDNSIRINLLILLGFLAFFITYRAVYAYAKQNVTAISARIIISILFLFILISTTYFFANRSGYGIFKIQTWLMPLLIPVYVFYIVKSHQNRGIKLGCYSLLFANLLSGLFYLQDFISVSEKKRFSSSLAINHDVDLQNATQVLQNSDKNASIFLTNGFRTAWTANLLRKTKIDQVSHNAQPLVERVFTESFCKDSNNWPSTGLILTFNKQSASADIVEDLKGEQPFYKNNKYSIYHANKVKQMFFVGEGAYPLEFSNGNYSFPKKFRWVENNLEVILYSSTNKIVNLWLELTPGYVETTLPRNINVKVNNTNQMFKLDKKSILIVKNVNLHAGFNCVNIGSPDVVKRYTRPFKIIRPDVPVDPRLLNFAISQISTSAPDDIKALN